jgi:hypothetical protein
MAQLLRTSGECYVYGIMHGKAVSRRVTGYHSFKDRFRRAGFEGRSPDPEPPRGDFQELYIV